MWFFKMFQNLAQHMPKTFMKELIDNSMSGLHLGVCGVSALHEGIIDDVTKARS